MKEKHYTIKKADPVKEPGTWWLVNSKVVMIQCPDCGNIAHITLGSVSRIGRDGVMYPLFRCPNRRKLARGKPAPCTFHQLVKLEDWREPKPEAPKEEPLVIVDDEE